MCHGSPSTPVEEFLPPRRSQYGDVPIRRKHAVTHPTAAAQRRPAKHAYRAANTRCDPGYIHTSGSVCVKRLRAPKGNLASALMQARAAPGAPLAPADVAALERATAMSAV